ncbi:ribonuclease G [bacterium]|nr:ribonuclease G [bacterium]
MENTENKNCPFCGGEIPVDAKKCKFCGEWINKDDNSLPKEIQHFNWGAFLLNWIWGIMNKKYITLLYFPACLLPIIGPLAISIWFGFAGNKWAWESQNWDSTERFNEVQKNWVRLWFILLALGIILALKTVIIFAIIGSIEV